MAAFSGLHLLGKKMSSSCHKAKKLTALLHQRCSNRCYSAEVLPKIAFAGPSSVSPKAHEVLDPTKDVIDPLNYEDFFEVHKYFTVRDLFEARVHLGHKDGTLNDFMRPYVFGSRLGHLIIDLDQTAHFLRVALNVTAHIAFRRGIIMFMSKNPLTAFLVEQTAKECGEYAHVRRWQGGVLTNANAQFGTATLLPSLIIGVGVLNGIFELHSGIRSAAKMLIPTVGIVDTNSDPTLISYPVPGNDDTPCAIELYCRLFKQAIMAGKQKRKEMEEQGMLVKEYSFY